MILLRIVYDAAFPQDLSDNMVAGASGAIVQHPGGGDRVVVTSDGFVNVDERCVVLCRDDRVRCFHQALSERSREVKRRQYHWPGLQAERTSTHPRAGLLVLCVEHDGETHRKVVLAPLIVAAEIALLQFRNSYNESE